MSALSACPSNHYAPSDLREAYLLPMRADALAGVMQVEREAYDWPWAQANMADSIASGYLCLQLMGEPATLLGYMVAMQGVDEVHLLNLTTAPAYQRQGWARVMLDALALWARSVNAQWLWLEVRVSNAPAIAAYAAFGFRRVGQRKNYYPGQHGQREDAIVMSYKL